MLAEECNSDAACVIHAATVNTTAAGHSLTVCVLAVVLVQLVVVEVAEIVMRDESSQFW